MYHCQFCPSSLVNISSLRIHHRDYHPGALREGPLRCAEAGCSLLYGSAYAHYRHLGVSHPPVVELNPHADFEHSVVHANTTIDAADGFVEEAVHPSSPTLSKSPQSFSGTIKQNALLFIASMFLSHLNFGNRLLVWDSFRCHISAPIKEELKRLKLDNAVVPGGCTMFVQAPDVCWNAPSWAEVRLYHEDWLLNGEKIVTAAGNMRPPLTDAYLEWIVNV
uniref:C2H2-type domain-containing protein n=1 Tax=Plectus sambesii TaxID=2011161 RepID=A0A914VVJ7_9BILA